MREDIELCNFSAGELSPRLKGRTDYERYFNGCATMLNMVALPQGGATRRPGTYLVGLAADQTGYGLRNFASRCIPFIFSTVQAYMLVFTAGTVSVYANDGAVMNGDTPVTISVPYQQADLALLSYTQSADTLYIAHPDYPFATITRSSNTSWSYQAASFEDGPYLVMNATTTTMSISGTTGNQTATFSSTTGINNGAGFGSGDVGRLIRMQLFSLWAWMKINSVNSSTSVDVTIGAWVINNGAWGAVDGAPWAANTRYITGAVVVNNSLYYIATSGGISGAGYGPCGTGDNIIDGSVVWSLAGPWNATGWASNTIYACGDIVQYPQSGGTYYQCIQGGNGGTAGGPTGTGNNIVVNDTIWESMTPFSFPTTTVYWQLGAYSPGTGYPYLVTFWQGRLCLLGTTNQPNCVNASVSNDFLNFAPTQPDGTVVAANALSWLINDTEVNAPRWVTPAGSSVAMQLGIGTSSGETIMQPATNAEPLSAGNVQVYRETAYGAAAGVPALRIGKSTLFVNRPGRKLIDWIWQWAVNGFVGLDRTVDAEHITRRQEPGAALEYPGIVMMAYQQQPYNIVWCTLADGSLIGLTYLPEQRVIAWHRHALGGEFWGGAPVIESIAVIPSPDGTYDELWMTVVRTTDASPWFVRTVEVMTRFFDNMRVEDGCFMDCALASALQYPQCTLSIWLAEGEGTVQTSENVFSDASVGAYIRANSGIMVITSVQNAQNASVDVLLEPVDTQWAPAGDWSYGPQYASFSGFLAGFDNSDVQVLGDGADMGLCEVTDGAITLPGGQTASYAIAGLPQTYDLVTMPWAPSRAGAIPAAGKMKKMDHLYLRLFETLGCQYGQLYTDEDSGETISNLDTLLTRSTTDAIGQPPAIESGMFRLALDSGFDLEGQIEITGSGPYPCTVLAICAAGDVGAS